MPYKNKEANARYAREYTQKLRLQVLSHYSNGKPHCNHCPEARLGCLTLDHINGGGRAHTSAINRRGQSYYGWIIRNDYPSFLQVLCMNCQLIKRRENNEYKRKYIQ